MSTYERLLDGTCKHIFGILPAGRKAIGDWSDLAACAAPLRCLCSTIWTTSYSRWKAWKLHMPALGRYTKEREHPEQYQGRFYPGPHKCDRAMQRDAFAWLGATLAGGHDK